MHFGQRHIYRQFFPGGMIPGSGTFPGGFPGFPGFPSGIPGSGTSPGGFPGFPGSGGSQAPSPSAQIVNKYQYLVQNPSQAQGTLGGTPGIGGVGCDGRWTIVLLKNGQLFLMFVISANAAGNTTGLIWPAITFGSFPTSSILAYSC